MNKIKKALIKVDAENKDYYEANYKRYAKECDKLDTLYKEETSKLTKKELVVAHGSIWLSMSRIWVRTEWELRDYPQTMNQIPNR